MSQVNKSCLSKKIKVAFVNRSQHELLSNKRSGIDAFAQATTCCVTNGLLLMRIIYQALNKGLFSCLFKLPVGFLFNEFIQIQERCLWAVLWTLKKILRDTILDIYMCSLCICSSLMSIMIYCMGHQFLNTTVWIWLMVDYYSMTVQCLLSLSAQYIASWT